jgi:SAM-dependent methyltransferase
MTRPVVSFRDPAGTCCVLPSRVLRWVSAAARAEFEGFLDSTTAAELGQRSLILSTRRLAPDEHRALATDPSIPQGWPPDDPAAAVYEHPRIPFPSYPHEWPPEMLWEAGRLTLEIARLALADGWGLKDATPLNVMFQAGHAVFIDLPSFERRAPGDAVWRPYAQFVRTFLLPLLAHRLWGVPLADVFLNRRDGLEPEEVYAHCGYLTRLRPAVLSLVSLPTWLGRSSRKPSPTLYEPRPTAPDKARFIVESLLGRLTRSLERLQPVRHGRTAWSDYMQTHSYRGAAFGAKEAFVQRALQTVGARRVLDIGANTGHFSALAAKAGASVVALDLDPVCVGAIWQRTQAERLDLLPLVVNLARPSPAVGWRNHEWPAFLERATGAFGCLLMLAVLHHLLVTERIPLDEVLDLAAELTTDAVVLEFVDPADEMFRQLTRGRDHLHATLTPARFEASCQRHFRIVDAADVPNSRRRLYLLRKPTAAV